MHQAIGMAMHYLDCSASEALRALAMLALSTERTLVAVATDVVERRLRLPYDSN